MKKIKFLILNILFIIFISSSVSFAQSFDFTSNHIKLENDKTLTDEYGYPVIKVTNTTDKDLDISYSFYINKTDTSNYDNNFTIKAKEQVLLKIPELSNLGSTNETRSIWFSWSEDDSIKPLQNQIETILFNSNKSPDSQLG